MAKKSILERRGDETPKSLRPPEGEGPHTNSGDGAVGQVSNKASLVRLPVNRGSMAMGTRSVGLSEQIADSPPRTTGLGTKDYRR